MTPDADENAVLLDVLDQETQIASDKNNEAQVPKAQEARSLVGIVTQSGRPGLGVKGGSVAVLSSKGFSQSCSIYSRCR